MFEFLLIVQSVVAILLVVVILTQRSEGGGLGVGGSSSGFMTARGAADFLTRSTSILGATFVILSIVMAAVAGITRETPKIDTSLSNIAAPAQGSTNRTTPAPAGTPEPAQRNPAVPLVP
ncbi:MAG: preprotein translocase subunit SecG [Sphingomicrobium sp.]